MTTDHDHFSHVLQCIQRIEEDTAFGRDGFLASSLMQDAVLGNLMVIAELTRLVPDAVKDERPSVGWQRIADFYDVLVRDDPPVDLELAWRIVQDDLPRLKAAIADMLQES